MTKQYKSENNIECLHNLYAKRDAITAEIEIFFEHEIAMQGVEITDELYKKYWNITHSELRGFADDVDSVTHELVLQNIYFRDVDVWADELMGSSDKLDIKFYLPITFLKLVA